MKRSILILFFPVLSFIIISSCNKDENNFTPIPETIIAGENTYQLYVDSLRMNAVELTEGLSGHWAVIEGTHTYVLSDINDPKCLFTGELLGYYKVRWTVSNGKDEKYEDVEINIIGFSDSRKGETYKAVQIGDQIWMAENLRATHYLNGDEIPDGTGAGDISDANNPGYWFPYNDDLDNVPSYGLLYTWYALNDSRNVCPSDWHVPTNAEWSELVDYLGGEFIAGGKLKENGTLHWFSPNEGATNESGFTALPGGMRGYGGPYGNLGYAGNWWSLTENTAIEAYSWGLSFHNESIYYGGSDKKVGFSIRCLKD